MEPFEITFAGQNYTIQPLISENFEVYQSGELVGFLTPTIQGEATLWSSREIEKDLASALGAQIERVAK